MCGIAGFRLAEPTEQEDRLQETAGSMAGALRHRGPDSSGTWADAAAGIALGHARLSILDLSPAGRQPMHSPDGRYSIVFNGEVYNHLELRPELTAAGIHFRGHSDTETMLAAFQRWGVAESLPRFNGMFAFAVYDGLRRTLTLVRDRLGVKPLYYGWQGGTLLFGSELKALRAHPAFAARIDRRALASYFRAGYIPCPHSIYQGIYKLPPGCRLETPAAGTPPPRSGSFSPWPDAGPFSPQPYWSAASAFRAGRDKPFTGSFTDAVDELEKILRSAVSLRLLSDVPLGAFLSGGIDSSLVAALMRQVATGPVKTFTIGSTDSRFDESGPAAAVAAHLGTEHATLCATPREALESVPLLPRMFDEPFADFSQIPTYLVSSLARTEVTVALSGDGGDEFFGGYRRYFQAAPAWERAAKWPGFVRNLLGGSLELVADCGLAGLFERLAPQLLPASFRSGSAADSFRKAGQVFCAPSARDYYRRLTTHWPDPGALVLGEPEAEGFFDRQHFAGEGFSAARRMMLWDVLTYLPDDILVKVDRASMFCSLEGRAPLLDYRALEFSATLPEDYLIGGGQGKRILRELLYRFVPPELVDRPKRGFSIPLGGWLRGELRDWAEELLDRKRLENEGYLAAGLVRKKWEEHAAGRRDWKTELWEVLMFQAWLEEAERS